LPEMHATGHGHPLAPGLLAWPQVPKRILPPGRLEPHRADFRDRVPRWATGEKQEQDMRTQGISNWKWSKEELDYLKENHSKIPLEEIATNLNRTYHAVKIKASRLDFAQPNLKNCRNCGRFFVPRSNYITVCSEKCGGAYIKREVKPLPSSINVARTKAWRIRARQNVLRHYSPDLKCQRCGFSDFRALTLDHIDGGGNQHRRKRKIRQLFMWVKRHNYPKGFQVLCMNCQFIKREENNEVGNLPHRFLVKEIWVK
jgi:hypothetical protein